MATDGRAPAAPRETAMGSPVVLALAWLAVGVPLLWGVAQTIKQSLALFH